MCISVAFRRKNLLAPLVVSLSFLPHMAKGGELLNLGVLNSGTASVANGVSANGSVVVGESTFDYFPNLPILRESYAFRWTDRDGMTVVGTLEGRRLNTAQAVSADGEVIVGFAERRQSAVFVREDVRAFRWTRATGMVDLGTLNGGNQAYAYGVNADGSVVVGYAVDGSFSDLRGRAFRWTAATGLVSLGTLNGGFYSRATGVSADGSVIVGDAADGSAAGPYGGRAFRWTQTAGMVSLGTLVPSLDSQATGVSLDGTVVVGRAEVGSQLEHVPHAFRWTEATGMVDLGTLMGMGDSKAMSYASATNSNGSVIVGSSTLSDKGWTAFRWTQATGMVSVEDWLRGNGVAVAAGLKLRSANGVSADGSVVVGALEDPRLGIYFRAYIARVMSTDAAPSHTGNGLMDVEEYWASLPVFSPSRIALDRANLVLHGAHNNPLLGIVPEGQSCSWVTGDAARDEVSRQDASAGVLEVGACHRFSLAQVGAAIGGARSLQALPLNGSVRQDGGYLMLEASAPVMRPDLWLTATGYYGWSDAQIERRYLNAGLPDASRANPNVPTWAARVRLDWQDALRFGGAGFSPYVGWSYVRARVDAYTEDGGGFPAQFDSRTESANQVRLGINVIRPVSERVRLLGTLEGVHQFNSQSEQITGQVLGLFGFTLPGLQYEQNWLRVGLGFDAGIGAGRASLMFNATSEGQDPSYWVSASYRLTF